MKRIIGLLALAFVTLMLNDKQSTADEGLWLFNNPPKALLKSKHNFDAPQSWYDHLQKSAVGKDLKPEEAFEARRGVIAKIEAEATKEPYRGDVVTLYQGGQYHLYKYRRYTDIRLVFAPEQQIAFFGGDPANFAYPRYDLDMCFFRVYENDKPAKIEHYLKWSKDGVKDNDLVLVAGHPGHTDRLNTVADLEYQRDIRYPFALQRLNRLEVMLSVYGMRGADHERKSKDALF